MSNLCYVIQFDDNKTSEPQFRENFPSPLINYPIIKKKSSQILISPKEGIIIKTKKRNLSKAIYEFLSLGVWNNLLNEYSNLCNLGFNSPVPLGYNSDSDTTQLSMSFISGIPFKKLGQIKGNPFIFVPALNGEFGLQDAVSFYLGALNAIKEKENLLHSDYDDRHLLFDMTAPSIGIVDVENSKISSSKKVSAESSSSLECLVRHFNSRKYFNRNEIDYFYSQGKKIVSSVDNDPLINQAILKSKKDYNLDMDFIYKD